MLEIPLFPLNTVLFPGTPINLHIFEPRYIQMIKDYQDSQIPFGVVLIKMGMEALGPLAEPYSIGCMSRILQIQLLEGGKMNLVAVGGERFRLLGLDRQSKPYLVGQVQPYPLENIDPIESSRKLDHLRRQFDRFIEKLQQVSPNQLDLDDLPSDEVSFAYFSAAVLQISPRQKQELLTLSSLDRLVARLEHHYQREITLLDVILKKEESLQAGGFSRN
jgi:Lon protease-like protein